MFTHTKEGKWVNDNCYKFGFCIRFPQDKAEITGYKYESWHIRYVGVSLAKELYNEGNWLSMEEFFGLTSTYNYEYNEDGNAEDADLTDDDEEIGGTE